MLSIETENKLCSYLIYISETEKQLEKNKQTLNTLVNFDPFRIFNRIDSLQKGNIDWNDIQNFYKDNLIYCSDEEAKSILSWYDYNYDAKLAYPEFLNMIIANETRNIVIKDYHSDCNNKCRFLSYEVESILSEVLNAELKFCRTSKDMILDIRTRYDFSLFKIISSLGGGDFITSDKLVAFFKKNRIAIDQKNIDFIIKRLDIQKNGKIAIHDIKKIFTLFEENSLQKTFPIENENNTNLKDQLGLNFDYCINHKIHNAYQNTQFSDDSVKITNTNNNNNTNFNQTIPKNEKLRTRGSKTPNSNYRKNKTYDFKGNSYSKMARGNSKEIKLRNSSNTLRSNKYNSNNNNTNNNEPIIESNSNQQNKQTLPTPDNYQNENNNNNNNVYSNNAYSVSESTQKQNKDRIPSIHQNEFAVTNRSSRNYFISQYNEVINFFELVFQTEVEIEKQKYLLASRKDFNVEDAFRLFETKASANYSLSEFDILSGMNCIGLYPSHTEVKNIIKRYSLKQSGDLNFADFFDMLVPFDRDYRQIVENRKPSPYTPKFNKSDYFLGSTKKSLGDLLEKIIISENRVNILRKRVCVYGVNAIKDFIRNIDGDNKGYINHHDIRKFYKEICGKKYSSDKECDLCFIRFDTDRDGKVMYEDLLRECLDSSW